jgi:hypothetical protein
MEDIHLSDLFVFFPQFAALAPRKMQRVEAETLRVLRDGGELMSNHDSKHDEDFLRAVRRMLDEPQDSESSSDEEGMQSHPLPQFAELTQMLVIPFVAFKAHGSIPRSDEAKRLGLRIPFDKSAGHIAVFISHRRVLTRVCVCMFFIVECVCVVYCCTRVQTHGVEVT